jgi:tetratricopeptide (TPR) repeat protein
MIAHNLQTLEDSGLIRLAAAQPELEYLFRHTLVQEATYRTLLREDRKRLHAFVGDTLERDFPERRAELAPILARHFAEAGDDRRALHYYALAGDHAAQRYANAEAAMHYTRAVELLAAGADLAGTRLSELYTKRGRVLELSGQYAEALANYRAMQAVALRRGDRALELAALVLVAQTRSTPNPFFDADEGAALSAQALQLARALGDRQAEAKILWNLVNLCAFTGRTAEGIQYGEQALRLARELGLREQTAYILNDIWRAYLANGQWESALASANEASLLWRELQNLPMLTDGLATSAELNLFGGLYDEALRSAEDSLQLSRSIHNIWGQSYSQFAVGHIHWDRGDPARAIEVMEASIRLSIEAGFTTPQIYTRSELALVYGSLGDDEYGIELAEQAAQLAAAQFPAFQPPALAVLAILHLMKGAEAEADRLLRLARADFAAQNPLVKPVVFYATVTCALAQGDYPQALEAANEFINYVAAVHMRYMNADAFYLKGRALLETNRLAEASAAFAQAQREAESMGARRIEWQILMGQSALASQTGQPGHASALRRQAREIVSAIAAHTPDRLRASFLALPQVRAVFDL